ncbi:unnamed protein product [Cladocopium goreaui]|uniref:ADP-ribosylglycohydrolase n=1 Tax=Cladocopium goreaui TaxID=2562237 RepID=A0A9P1BSG2_9DINO|nr:unnamed protein product [Cladocopium goreaui]
MLLLLLALPLVAQANDVQVSSEPVPIRRVISKDVLYDKLMGYWVGQLVGNFMGLPFEFTYWDEPMPIEPQTYYDEASANASGLNVNGPCESDGRGCIPQTLDQLQGAYTDDDTDIEFVTLHALEKHGLDLNYEQIAEYWKTYINIKVNGSDTLWFANKVARENMDKDLVPPATGSKANNEFWWTIDPQLVNELWSVIYPGMVDQAVDRAEWGARITSDSWGTHPTRFYAAMYSAAFFIQDVRVLYRIGRQAVPKKSPFRRALVKVYLWKKQSPDDWRPVWQKIRENFSYYPKDCGDMPWPCAVSSIINGVLGAMAFLYGNGDFKKTVGIAIAAGFDCDNQAATLAGLLGVMHGESQIPPDLTRQIAGNNWAKAFNDVYVNTRRPPLPRNQTNSGIVGKIMILTQRAVVEEGGEDLGDKLAIKVSHQVMGG